MGPTILSWLFKIMSLRATKGSEAISNGDCFASLASLRGRSGLRYASNDRNSLKFDIRQGLTIFILSFALTGFSNPTLSDIELAIMQEDYKKAEKLAEQAIKKNSSPEKTNQAKYYLGISHLRTNQYAQAQSVFFELTHLPFSDTRDLAYLGLIDVYYAQGNYQEATKSIETLLRNNPHSQYMSLIYLKCAQVSSKLANWSKAAEYFKKITSQFPDSPESRLAQQLLEEKQYFAVQTGSFLDNARAQQLVDELKKKGEYAYIIETNDQVGRKFYRVRVGQFASLSEAEQLQQKLSQLGYPTKIFP